LSNFLFIYYIYNISSNNWDHLQKAYNTIEFPKIYIFQKNGKKGKRNENHYWGYGGQPTKMRETIQNCQNL
jgi:hypothetical protein